MSDCNLKNGDIVWAKWNNLYWPGHYRDIESVRAECPVSAKYVAAVEFFNEKQYEFLTSRGLDLIRPYDCDLKHDLIKKGLQKQRQLTAGSYMDKFLEDVKHAQVATGGDPDILQLPEFAKEEKNRKNYIGLTAAKFTRKCEDIPEVASPVKKTKLLDSPGLPSSGTTVDSDSDYDSDALSTSAWLRDAHFEVDQIVWVPHGKAHYLAFVTRVDQKKHKVSLRWVLGSRDVPSFTKSSKVVLDFRDVDRNKRLLEAALQFDPEMSKSYERCLQFVASRCNPEKTLSAFRFLTYHPRDLNYGALPDKILDRYLGKDVPTTDLEMNEEMRDEEEKQDAPVEGGERKSTGLPIITFTSEQTTWLHAEAAQLLLQVRSRECVRHLADIQSSKTTCFRHETFNSGQRQMLEQRAGFGPFYDTNQALELIDLLHPMLSSDRMFHRRKYVNTVLLPEAVVFAMRKQHGLSEAEAEKRYSMTSTPPLLDAYLRTIGVRSHEDDASVEKRTQEDSAEESKVSVECRRQDGSDLETTPVNQVVHNKDESSLCVDNDFKTNRVETEDNVDEGKRLQGVDSWKMELSEDEVREDVGEDQEFEVKST